MLLLAIVGSGISADRLTDDAALTLLIHAVVIGLSLAAAITAVRGISGAHLNPAVTLSVAIAHGLPASEVAVYIGAQVLGALTGVIGANAMFGLEAISVSQTTRTGPEMWLSEFIATWGLMTVIWGAVSLQAGAAVAAAVGAYVTAAIWFTSSTAFANPAVTIARMFSDTYTGIAPGDVIPFMAAQLAGAGAATLLSRWLGPRA